MARAVFLGTSMGGLITMAVAALRSRAVAAAILNDVGPEISSEGLERIKSYVGRPAQIRDWEDAAAYVRRVNLAAFPLIENGDWMRLAKRTFREVEGTLQLDYDPNILVPLGKSRHGAGLIAKLLFRRLARKRPTLLLKGAISDLISPEIAERMQRAAPGLVRVDIPDVGHAPMLDEPEAIAAIEQFLKIVA